MMWVIGVALFALAILVSVALHECGHMWVARATGMKVRRYFVGFGPTLWSTRRPNKLGYTEYGVKAVPLGGFCDIAGMTSIDEIAPEDRPYAMYKQKTWKRAAVLLAGPGMNFIVGLVHPLRHRAALGLSEPANREPAAYVSQTSCVAPAISKDKFADCAGDGPAAAQASSRATSSSRWATPTWPTPTRWSPRSARPAARRRSSSKRDGKADHHGHRRREDPALHVRHRHGPVDRRRGRRLGRRVRAGRVHAVQPGHRDPRHGGVHRRSGRGTGQVAGEDSDQDRCAGALDRRRRTRSRDADQRRRCVDHRRRRLRARAVPGLLVLPGAAELRARGDQPGASAAVRRRSHRGGLLREDPQPDPTLAWPGGRGAGELSQADARHLRDPGLRRRLHGADRDRGLRQPHSDRSSRRTHVRRLRACRRRRHPPWRRGEKLVS